MYSAHQGATLIPANLKTGKYEFNGESAPTVHASASTKNGVVSITLCNLNPNKAETVDITITGQNFSTAGGQIVTAKNMNDYNDFGQEEKVTLKSFAVKKPKDGKLSIELPAKSVMLVQLQ